MRKTRNKPVEFVSSVQRHPEQPLPEPKYKLGDATKQGIIDYMFYDDIMFFGWTYGLKDNDQGYYREQDLDQLIPN